MAEWQVVATLVYYVRATAAPTEEAADPTGLVAAGDTEAIPKVDRCQGEAEEAEASPPPYTFLFQPTPKAVDEKNLERLAQAAWTARSKTERAKVVENCLVGQRAGRESEAPRYRAVAELERPTAEPTAGKLPGTAGGTPVPHSYPDWLLLSQCSGSSNLYIRP
jgi:hypothetical protein